MAKSRCANYLVQPLLCRILVQKFGEKQNPEQIVLALRSAFKDDSLKFLLKSAGVVDVKEFEIMKFHHAQIDQFLKRTNDTKKKGRANDKVRSAEQMIYSAMAQSPPSSNNTMKVSTLKSWALLFPSVTHSTIIAGMKRGKIHCKKIREEGTKFLRVVKYYRKKISFK